MKKDTVIAIRQEDGGLRFAGLFDRAQAKLWVAEHKDWFRDYVIGTIEHPGTVISDLKLGEK